MRSFMVFFFRNHFTPDRNLQQFFNKYAMCIWRTSTVYLGQGKWFPISTECALRCTHKNPNNNDNNREKLI